MKMKLTLLHSFVIESLLSLSYLEFALGVNCEGYSGSISYKFYILSII